MTGAERAIGWQQIERAAGMYVCAEAHHDRSAEANRSTEGACVDCLAIGKKIVRTARAYTEQDDRAAVNVSAMQTQAKRDAAINALRRNRNRKPPHPI